MTMTQIQEEVRAHRPCNNSSFYRHVKKLKIKPLGDCRQRPQHWPEDTAKRILAHLGYMDSPAPAPVATTVKLANGHTMTTHQADANGRVVSLGKLRSERAKAKVKK